MKKIVSLLLSVVMIFGCLCVLSSCASKDNGAKINIYLGNRVYDFDPSDYYVDSNAEQFLALVYEPLFRIDEKGNLKNAAAKDYEVDEEKRVITITLDETYWSDDKRVTASDYVYAWRRILDPDNVNGAAVLFNNVENAMNAKNAKEGVSVFDVGFVASGTYEIKITYVERADYNSILANLASIATSPVREDMVTKYPGYWSKNISTMAFNGPFKVTAVSEANGTITLSRNLGYHQALDEKNYTDEVLPGTVVGSFTVAGEQVPVTYGDLENKVVFYMGDASLADRKANKDNAIVADTSSTYSYLFNTDNPLFANKDVRYALSIAIDREAIISAITFGKAADGLVPDAFGGSSEALLSTSANISKANEILSSVEFTPDMKKTFTLSVDDNEQSRAIAEIVKTAWESLDAGFKVNVKYLAPITTVVGDITFTDSATQVAVKNAGYGIREYDVLGIDLMAYSADGAVNTLALFTSNMHGCGANFADDDIRANLTGFSDSQYDRMVKRAGMAVTDSAKAKWLNMAEKYIIEQSPVVPLVFNQSFAFVNDELKNVEFDGLGHVVFTKAKLKNYEDYLED